MKSLMLFFVFVVSAFAGPPPVEVTITNGSAYELRFQWEDASGINLKPYATGTFTLSTANFAVSSSAYQSYCLVGNSDFTTVYATMPFEFDTRASAVNCFFFVHPTLGNIIQIQDVVISEEMSSFVEYFFAGFALVTIIELAAMARRMAGKIADVPGDL